MTTATAQAAANLAFIKYWGTVPENVAVDKLLQILEFKNRSASYVEEIIAFVAHARIPNFCIGFPGIMCKLVGIWLSIHNEIIHGTAAPVNL